jgi:hypothetical protein
MIDPRFDGLVEAVQANCDIADAKFAGDLGLCTYLLEMREFYRWRHGFAFSAVLPREEIGKWIAEREALWKTVEGADFAPLPVSGRSFQPFDAAEMNQVLTPCGLVYGAGFGRFGKPQFFLGQLKRSADRDGAHVVVVGGEYARDLAAPPAALMGQTIYLREEALKRWLWQKIEAVGARGPGSALKQVLDAYRFGADADSALNSMVEGEGETLVLHEYGELQAGRILGAEWGNMRARLGSRRAELIARAVRDNLADSLVTVPALLEAGAVTSIHFWFSTFEGVRRELFPRATSAYAAWCGGDGGAALCAAMDAGRGHWRDVCKRILECDRNAADADSAIAGLLDAPETVL